MLIKINRQECINRYPSLPLRDYDYDKDEEIFIYPKISASYIFTLASKSFKGHIKQIVAELIKIIWGLGTDRLVFLGDTELPWLYQHNDYKPAAEAEEYLAANKIGKRFNGGLQVNIAELPVFIKHIGWLTRCNASLPYFHFTDPKQNIIGHICKYGNLHVDTLNTETSSRLKEVVKKTSLKFMIGNNCHNQHGRTSAIFERKIKVK